MMNKAEDIRKKVYVETTVISDATSLPARDIVQLGRQVVTREWWATAAQRFDLFSSPVVAKEIRRGDSEAAQRRIDALAGIPELDVSERELELAHKLVDGKAVPKEFPDDAMHIAVAAAHAMDYLVSWNFKHITNGYTIPLVEKICRQEGYMCPCICTPQMLQEGGRE